MLSNTHMKFNEISHGVVFKKKKARKEIIPTVSTSTLFIHAFKMPCVFYKTLFQA